jgi:glycosyltransferase involved in cell wall biosynthesis
LELPDNFRAEFINAITGSHEAVYVLEKRDGNILIRERLSRIKLLRMVYRNLRKVLVRAKKSNSLSLDLYNSVNISSNLDLPQDDSRTKLFLVVPSFLEMNGPFSHYGDLLEIGKSLDMSVFYVASEQNYQEEFTDGSFKDFEGVKLLDASGLNNLFAEKAIVINCGSAWVYRNLESLTARGNLVIDYLFNHVGHTASNLRAQHHLFHTVCQHHKLLQILQESTGDKNSYSCIPIPIPVQTKNIIDYEQRNDSPLWVGRLSPEKGVDRLVKIAAEYCRQTGMPIRVIGSGPLSKTLKSSILSGSIEFLGGLSHEKTLAEIANSKVVINTSYIEGVSLVAMESLALGAYVVSYNIGGMSELLWHPQMKIQDGDSKDFVDFLVDLSKNNRTSEVDRTPVNFTQVAHQESWKKLLNLAETLMPRS